MAKAEIDQRVGSLLKLRKFFRGENLHKWKSLNEFNRFVVIFVTNWLFQSLPIFLKVFALILTFNSPHKSIDEYAQTVEEKFEEKQKLIASIFAKTFPLSTCPEQTVHNASAL